MSYLENDGKTGLRIFLRETLFIGKFVYYSNRRYSHLRGREKKI